MVEVREVSLQDYEQIAELESRHGLETKTYDEWTHLWMNNPVYQPLARSWPAGWVLEDSNRKIIGYLGNIPLSYVFEGKKILAATSRSWVVDAAYRSYSLLLLDYFFAQTNVDLFLTTTLNTDALEGFLFFAPSPVPVGDWDHSNFWVTNYAGFLTSSLMVKEIPFAKPLSYPLSIPLFIRDRLSRRALKTIGTQASVQSCWSFDERFDTFWENLQVNQAHTLLGMRTREILNWHFKHALLRRSAWIFCVNDGPRILAYSVFYCQDNPKFGLKRLRLADFQTLTNDNLLLIPMLSRALDRSRCAGIHMLEIMGLSPEKAQVVEKLNPYRRKLRSWLSFYKTNDRQLAERLRDPKIWDLSCFDGDSSL